MWCVLELCAFVLGVWCTCAAFSQIVRHPLVNVFDIAWVRRPVLCSGAVHVCVVALASPMLALRAPAVPALAVRACAVCLRAVCGVLVQRSSTSCGARRPCIPVDPGDLP
eukprot:Tamp_24947.p4 GENE.Tamp_24947~~Tamp_24947.p4  ORF type:complete len:110 (+),score=11.79 Tamp_24947:408-737(+)